MKYLLPSFTMERPEKVFGCAACIYGETHGYWHTHGMGCLKGCLGACAHGDPLCPCQDGDLCHYEGPNPMPAPQRP